MSGAVHAAGGAPAAADAAAVPGGIGPGPSAVAAAGIVHASCVAFGGAGVLILGPSGSGKSALALALMGLGAALVADDRVLLTLPSAPASRRPDAGTEPDDAVARGGRIERSPGPGAPEAPDAGAAAAGSAPGDPPDGGPRGAILAQAPEGLPRWIEARGIGLLHAPVLRQAQLALVVDLGRAEADRLPPRRLWHWRGAAVACVHAVATGHFPAAIRHYVLWGRAA